MDLCETGCSPVQPPKEEAEPKGPPQPSAPSPPPLGYPQTCTPAPHQCHWVIFGVHGSHGPSTDPPRRPPCRQTQGRLPRGWVALYDVTTGTKMGLGGPT